MRGKHVDKLKLVLLATMMVAPVVAHHSFTMFDMTKRITLNGTVTAFEWTNPHCYIEIDVPDESGAAKHWSIELGSPSILLRSGWKYSDVKPGDKVTVIVNPLRDGRPGGMLYRLTLPDGSMRGNGVPPPPDPPATR